MLRSTRKKRLAFELELEEDEEDDDDDEEDEEAYLLSPLLCVRMSVA